MYTEMPWSIAVASVKGLNALPAVRPACDARLNFIVRPVGEVRDHRLDGARARIDGDERRRRIGLLAQHAADGGARRVLHARVERRAHLQPARLDLLRAEALHELLRRPAEEVRMALRAVQRAGLQADRVADRAARTASS